MDYQTFKDKISGARQSLTMKFNAGLIAVSQGLDPLTKSVQDYLPSIKPYIKPETITVVGNVLLAVGIIGAAIRAFHTKDSLEAKVARPLAPVAQTVAPSPPTPTAAPNA